jgi:3-deoxy-D-manno-octulosonic-acid transferase
VAADRLPAVRAALDHWSPQVLVLAGPGLPAALIAEASDRGIPLLLIEYRPPAQGYIGRGMTGSLLARFARILVLDHAAAERTLRLAPERSAPVAVGRIDEIAEPLPSTEAERSALAAIIGTRPVWLAAGVPEAEEEAVIAAQVQILRQMHRTLLILAPQESGRADDIAQRAAREGWGVALRAHDEDPGKDTQLLIADGSSELGMWYRLAPVTYLGGTLSGGATRSPLEAAALGSAVVAGPEHGAEAGRLARLAEARALSPVRDAAGLAGAVGELLAPDRAALLAHNAWMVTSGGSEVTERIAEAIVAELDRSQEATTAAGAAGAAV